jgi:hypothetical protein
MAIFEVKFDIIDLSEAAQDGFVEEVIERCEKKVIAADVVEAVAKIEAEYTDEECQIGVYFNECQWVG